MFVQVEAKVLLGDRRLHITLARVWASLSSWEKAKLMWMFVHSGLTVSKIKKDIADDIEKLKVCLPAARGLLHRLLQTKCATFSVCAKLLLFVAAS